MNDEYSIFDGIRMQAQGAIDDLDVQIISCQREIEALKSEKRKLQSVIKAASDKPLNLSSHKQKKLAGIRDVTRKRVMDAIRMVSGNVSEFTVEDIKVESNLAESTTARAINVLREEGLIRRVGVEGRAPVYKWVGE